jgi:hypothetical protein
MKMSKLMPKWLGLVWLVMLLMSMFSTYATTTVNVFSAVGPSKISPSYPAFMANAIASIKNTGTLPSGPRTSPTDAKLLVGSASAEDVMTSTTVRSYRGALNPVAPWDGEYGNTRWDFYDVSAGEGLVSMADLTIVMVSSDTGNFLGKTTSFVGTFYASTAIGIRADGTVVDSGPATQEVKRVIVPIAWKSFSINSDAQVTEVRNYVQAFPNWNLQSTASVKGVVTPIQVGTPGRPKLTGIVESGKFFVVAESNGDTAEYNIELTDMFEGPSTYWVTQGTIRAGQKKEIQTIGSIQEARFIRYVPTP